MANERYGIIQKAAGTYNGRPAAAGEVVDAVMWDGTSAWAPPAGTEARADPDGALQIGQTATV